MSENSTQEDLLMKVKELLSDITEAAEGQLCKLQNTKAGVLQDHEMNGQNWATPRDFVVAFLSAHSETILPSRLNDRKRKHTITQYLNHL